MSTFSRQLTPAGIGALHAVYPVMQPGNGNSMSATVSTVGGGTETLAVAIFHFSLSTGVGSLLQEQGPTGGINSITVSPNANDAGLYVAAYQVSSLSPNITLSITSPNGTIKGLVRVRRSGAWVLCVPKVRRSGAWDEYAQQVRRSGAWVLTTF